ADTRRGPGGRLLAIAGARGGGGYRTVGALIRIGSVGRGPPRPTGAGREGDCLPAVLGLEQVLAHADLDGLSGRELGRSADALLRGVGQGDREFAIAVQGPGKADTVVILDYTRRNDIEGDVLGIDRLVARAD